MVPIVLGAIIIGIVTYVIYRCCFRGSPKPTRNIEFKAHIAIDFGTAGCGLAFAYKHNGSQKVEIYNKFNAGKRQTTNKTKTCLLINEKDEILGFGANAKFMYEQTMGKQKRRWKYFERFKMALYEHKLSQSRMDLLDKKKRSKAEIKDSIPAMNGYPTKSEKVFVIAFQYLGELANKYLRLKIKLKPEQIQWILTVPAIWSDKSKNKMRQWIIKSGLVDATIKDQCIIVYEPDCASLAIQKEYFHDNNEGQKQFKPGNKYILVDAGGGTVDVACHKILENGDVEEIVHPTGDAWGSCYIDDLYIELLEQIFSTAWIKEFKYSEPGYYLEIMGNFQEAKKHFKYFDKPDVKTHAIQLPYQFLQYLEEKCGDTDPETIVKQFKKPIQYYRNLFKSNENIIINMDEKKSDMDDADTQQIDIKLRSVGGGPFTNSVEFIDLDNEIWKTLFDSKINPIIKHVDGLWNRKELKHQCNFLCLVGGFSGSTYFQSRIKTHFGLISKYKMEIIIPKLPILAVVEGAAYMGITKNYIRARKLKYSYGINKYFTVDKAKQFGISNEYIGKNKTSDGYVDNCFEIIARKNERVALGAPVPHVVFATSTTTTLPILRSDNSNPKTADEGVELGEITLYDTVVKEEIMTEFHFDKTMFTVYAYPKNKKNCKKKQIKINYAQ